MQIVLEKIDNAYYIDVVLSAKDLKMIDGKGIVSKCERLNGLNFHVGVIDEKVYKDTCQLVWEDDEE